MLVSVYIFFPLVLTDLLDEKQQLVGIFRQYQRLKQEIVVQSLAVVFFYFHVSSHISTLIHCDGFVLCTVQKCLG